MNIEERKAFDVQFWRFLWAIRCKTRKLPKDGKHSTCVNPLYSLRFPLWNLSVLYSSDEYV